MRSGLHILKDFNILHFIPDFRLVICWFKSFIRTQKVNIEGRINRIYLFIGIMYIVRKRVIRYLCSIRLLRVVISSNSVKREGMRPRIQELRDCPWNWE